MRYETGTALSPRFSFVFAVRLWYNVQNRKGGAPMADLNTDIRYIKGVGEARAKAFEKLGVFTLGDLIAYYPRRWEDRSQLYPIRDLPEGSTPAARP